MEALDQTDGDIRAAQVTLIRQQNDAFRSSYGANFTIPGQVLLTPGVSGLSVWAQARVMVEVMTFNTFTEDNDPHREHDFGAFEVEDAGETYRLFWKIDLYSNDLRGGSPEPSDLRVTTRVLTIMLRSEY